MTRWLWLVGATVLACGFLVLGARAAAQQAGDRAAARGGAATLLSRLRLPPAGSRRLLSGPGVTGFAWRQRRGVLRQRRLIVHAVALADGSTGVRADAQVVWVTSRPARERVPAGERRLRVTVGRRSLLVTSAGEIREAIRLLNALPAAQRFARVLHLPPGFVAPR